MFGPITLTVTSTKRKLSCTNLTTLTTHKSNAPQSVRRLTENKSHTQMALTCAVIMQLMQMAHSAAFFTQEVLPLIKIWEISQMIYSLNLLSNIFNTVQTMQQQLTIKKMVLPEEVAVAPVNRLLKLRWFQTLAICIMAIFGKEIFHQLHIITNVVCFAHLVSKITSAKTPMGGMTPHPVNYAQALSNQRQLSKPWHQSQWCLELSQFQWSELIFNMTKSIKFNHSIFRKFR